GSIVGIIFKSIKIPVIIVATILGSIWINVSILAIQDIQVLYIGYLVVMSIQLGATIDYAVLFTHRYMEERAVKGKKDAFEEAFTKSSVSILISGSILTVVGFFEGFFSQIDSVKQIGYLLGSGAFISMLMILLLLPGALYYFDRWIIKKFKVTSE
ncbi:MAG: MMPL family transporter, partial [Candidatus Izemoplasmatales bacterium]|nr:MMPL family transporter [Candidatus Izemoplasmatales bacterium]